MCTTYLNPHVTYTCYNNCVICHIKHAGHTIIKPFSTFFSPASPQLCCIQGSDQGQEQVQGQEGGCGRILNLFVTCFFPCIFDSNNLFIRLHCFLDEPSRLCSREPPLKSVIEYRTRPPSADLRGGETFSSWTHFKLYKEASVWFIDFE